MLPRRLRFLPAYVLFFGSLDLVFGAQAVQAQVIPRNDVQKNLAAKPVVPKNVRPYPLPAEAQKTLSTLAGESDVLILGELHGSQEVPAVAAALLAPLAKLGYGVLALEIPADQQAALTDWATGKTKTVPNFFAKPVADGRGNIQALALIRTALSAPYRWKLICFDESLAETEKANAKIQQMDPKAMSPPFSDEFVAVCVGRDAAMAANLAGQRARLAPAAKVLAICGNFHAETSNHSAAESQLDLSADDSLNKFWPSFAAALENGHPNWRVKSVNVVPHGGGYFASTMSDDGEKESTGVQTVYSTRHFEQAEVQRLDDDRWNWELNLPRVTPVTFLAEPTAWTPSAASSVAATPETGSVATVEEAAPKELPPSAVTPAALPVGGSAPVALPLHSSKPASVALPAVAPAPAPAAVPKSVVAPAVAMPNEPAPKELPTAAPAPVVLPKNDPAPDAPTPNEPAPVVFPKNDPVPAAAPPIVPAPKQLPQSPPAPTVLPSNSPAPDLAPPVVPAPVPSKAPPTEPAPMVLPKSAPVSDVAPPPAAAPSKSLPAAPAPSVAPPVVPTPNAPAPAVTPPSVPTPAPAAVPPAAPAPTVIPPPAPTATPPGDPAPNVAPPTEPAAKPASPTPTPPGRFRGLRPRLFRFR